MAELDALKPFHPLISRWFEERFESPSEIQRKAWPEIAKGRHVLVTSPTGSGKTLTAFLWALDRLAAGAWPGGQVRVLYVSPLKALNNDVRVNLLRPLGELKTVFKDAKAGFPEIGVQTRSGDTPQNERRRMLKKPPEILITTPESLNILLCSKSGRSMFSGLASVILDEIHSVAGTKRGVHLITAVDRLVPLCGEFQRIALSATVRPKEVAAEFVGGWRMEGDPREPVYIKRYVSIIESEAPKKLSVEVRFPENAREFMENGSRWPALVREFKRLIASGRSTLFFANSRRLTEKVTRLINAGEDEPLAYSHHGSLSKELRLAVEKKLKRGELKSIVATNSLELGIDIGRLDMVALIQTPPSVSSAVQRIGRSGHAVGETSRGVLFPTHGRDFLNAAVMARCIDERDIEDIKPLECPLDVLSQVVLSMTATQAWSPDEMFAFLRTSSPYGKLSRRQFDLVVEMLAGRYAGLRMRELRPRISFDRVDDKIKAKSGASMLLYMAGGTIPDRGYYDLRVSDSRAKIGELDEEFVWERNVGETFALGSGTWKIARITHNDVEVAQVSGRPGIVPFWRAEARNRDFHYSEKIALFLERADGLLDRDPAAFQRELREKHRMDRPSAEELANFLSRQKEAARAPLPHRRHLLVEHFDDPLNRSDSKQAIVHTVWGGKINRPFAMAISRAWEKRFGYSLEIFADDDALLVMLPHEFGGKEILDLVHADNLETLLREKLETTGFFGARFRENAGRALLLPKAGFKRRMPLWMNRLRSKKLLEAVLSAPDFPILLETWRTCLRDEFDLENLKRLLDELAEGRIEVGEVKTKTSTPFAAGLIWQRTNKYMYEDDSPETGKTSGMGDEIFRLAISAESRPAIPLESIEELKGKLRRTAPGYSPSGADDLLDWVKERLLVVGDEWEELLSAVERDYGIASPELEKSLGSKIVAGRLPGAGIDSVFAVENAPSIANALGLKLKRVEFRRAFGSDGPDPEMIVRSHAEWRESTGADSVSGTPGMADFTAQWLSFYGPIPFGFVREATGLSDSVLSETLRELERDGRVVLDRVGGGEAIAELCDRENMEILLRMARKARRPDFVTLPVEKLPLFLAAFQGVATPGATLEDLQDRLEQLFGFCAPAGAWEEFILPCRLNPYYPAWLDSLIQSSDLCWFGCGERKIGFAFKEDLELFNPGLAPDGNPPEEQCGAEQNEISALLPDSKGSYGFFEIAGHSCLDSDKTTLKLWELAWSGKIGADTFEAVRSGVLNDFKPSGAGDVAGKSKRSSAFARRGGFNRWKSTRPLAGSWKAFGPPAEEADEMTLAELRKDRARQLFRRYGVLFKELLARETDLLQWRELFKTLRLMELSGEILSGRFFEGIQSLQFASHEAFRLLRRKLPEDFVYWMNAADPASLCGSGIEGLKSDLPARLFSNYLVFHGDRLVVAAGRNCKSLDIRVPPDDPNLGRYCEFFKSLLGRTFNPRGFVMVETINGEASTKSVYRSSLEKFGFVADYKGLELRRGV